MKGSSPRKIRSKPRSRSYCTPKENCKSVSGDVCNEMANTAFLYELFLLPYSYIMKAGSKALAILYCLTTRMYSTEVRVRTLILFLVAAVLCSCSLGMFTALPRFLAKLMDSDQADSDNEVQDSFDMFSGKCYSTNPASCYNIAQKPELEYKREGPLQGTSISLRYKQRLPVNKDVKREAVAALNIALDLQNRGKTEKALKVFQQAVALDPSHADILTAYGEFLEWHVKDVVKADHMYMIALEHSPRHDRALQNRRRTGPIVEEIDQARFDRVDQKRTLLHTVPHSHPGLRRAKREAYFAHIYHTNAIEGNTLTLSQTRSIVENKIAVGGKSLREQNEVLGLDSALSFINSTLVGRVGRLTLQDILDIHLRVFGYVDPSEAGRFRTTQVYVGDFIPPPAADLRVHMEQLVEWLNSEEASSLHPIEFAALAHYRLVAIHPFYDGNGRTSRLLMNLILMQAGFPPVSIEVNDRLTYYETLEQANDGDIRPFIRFISWCTERTLDEYLSLMNDDYELSLPSTFKRRKSSDKDRVIYVDVDDNTDDEDDDEDEDEEGFQGEDFDGNNDNDNKCQDPETVPGCNEVIEDQEESEMDPNCLVEDETLSSDAINFDSILS